MRLETEIGGLLYSLDTDKLVATVKGCEKYITEQAIPSSIFHEGHNFKVTRIGDDAFHGCSNLSSILIPEGIIGIGVEAFRGCCNLLSVNIPKGVIYIARQTFYNCTQLFFITIPESVTEIGDEAFRGTAWYNNQPDGVVYAGKMLYEYKGIMPPKTSVEVENGTLSITNSAFYGHRNLISISIPNSVKQIGYGAFAYCSSLASINIPNSVTIIDWNAFRNCSSLTSITLPEELTSIEGLTFAGCSSLTSITIPKNITNIGHDAFDECVQLADVYCHSDKAPWAIDAFTDLNLSLITLHVPENAVEEYKDTEPWCQFGTIVAIK